MELNEIKSIWKDYDNKLEKALKINQHCVEQIQMQKIKSRLAPLFWHRVIELALHSAATLLLLIFLSRNATHFGYAASALLLILFYAVAAINCVKQINIINRMDYSNDIVSIQSSLVLLQTNMVNHARLAVLCIPTFLAYPVVVSKAIKDFQLTAFADFDIIAQSGGSWWNAQLIASLVLIPLCTWFYNEVSYKNIHKKMVKNFIEKTSGKRVARAMQFAQELNNLK